MNICGCLVHTTPELASSAIATMVALDGVEVHAHSEDGRIVVVVEDTPERFASETIMDLHQIPGVISLTLTYHHFEETGGVEPVSPTKASHLSGDLSHEHF